MNDDISLSANEQRYESMFLSILQNEERIEPFLDAVFKFLYKKTDFFVLQTDTKQPYGFPDKVARQIVLKTFDKYNSLPKKQIEMKIENQVKQPTEPRDEKKAKEIVKKDATKEVKIEASESIDENLKKKQEFYQSQSESYNGAIRDDYSWSQSIKDIDIKVKIDSNIRKGKDVKVMINKDSLKIEALTQENQWKTLINDQLAWKIRPEESTWSLFPGDHIHINLEKLEERWWEQLVLSEEKLSLKNMNPEKPINDLEPEAQAKIEQLMYDQHRKRLGLPTSEEEKYQDMLKNAWNAEGSPFKGTQFDPKKISIKDGNISINPDA